MKVAVKKQSNKHHSNLLENFFVIYAKIMIEISVMIITLTETLGIIHKLGFQDNFYKTPKVTISSVVLTKYI